MAKVDIANSGAYIILPQKQFKRLMRILAENPDRKDYTITAKHIYDIVFIPHKYKSGFGSLRDDIE